jgi:lysophospholipase L1-like esterase
VTRPRPTPLALCLALAACRDPRVARGDDPRVRYEARTLTDWRGRVRFAWPRSAVHLRFHGAGLSARLTDTPYEDSLRDTDIVGVEVDGGPMRRVALRDGTRDYALAAGLAPGEHTLRLMKLTEAEVGTVRVDALTVSDGGALLAAAPAPRRRMLAVGDSITAGYGVNGPDASCGYGAGYNDASRAWVSRAADALGAELHVIAWSGRGVVRNYDPAVRETLPDVFARPVPTEPEGRCDLRAWRFDDVVINVGTNDTSRAGFDARRFARELASFVRRLRALYPAARVVLAVGPMLNERGPGADCFPRAQVLAAATEAAAAERRRGPCAVSVLELPSATPDEGCGCSSHPSARTHARMADQLVAHLTGLAERLR